MLIESIDATNVFIYQMHCIRGILNVILDLITL